MAGSIGRNSDGQFKLPVARYAATPFCYQVAAGVELLYALIGVVTDKRVSRGIDSNTARQIELAVARSKRTPFTDEGTRWSQLLHAM